ncbi:hypothetical protein EDB87DRAFT_1234319 [Lactarius vividus]|nr:hypothetical protein EDB87DRAFT_1234319 [Lactarius vividus]
MLQETERDSPLDIDTVAKLVIQPITCSWNGCVATMNSWHTLQKHFQLHCQDAGTSIKPKVSILIYGTDLCVFILFRAKLLWLVRLPSAWIMSTTHLPHWRSMLRQAISSLCPFLALHLGSVLILVKIFVYLTYIIGCLYAATALQGLTVHFLEQHQNLLHTHHQGHLLKPQASLSLYQPLKSLPLLPLKSNFFGYKLVSCATAIRLPFDKGLIA